MEVAKKVYVIYDRNIYGKSDIVKIIQDEEYKHDFYFGDLLSNPTAKDYMAMCSEVWCFGNCDFTLDYEHAVEMGYDIWQMA